MQLQRTLGNTAVQRLIDQNQLDPHTGQLQRAGLFDSVMDFFGMGGDKAPIEPLEPVTGQGTPTEAVTDHGRTFRLEGKTTAHFDDENASGFAVEEAKLSHAKACESECADGDPCVDLNGTLKNTYDVPITVDLPDLSSMDLTDCERKQAQEWIDTVLEPHEQEHVAKFKTFNGKTSHPISITGLCRSEMQTALDEKAQSMHDAERKTRQDAAQKASDALDPFNMDVKIDCPEADTDK